MASSQPSPKVITPSLTSNEGVGFNALRGDVER
ncbi:hypothetical protein FHX39_001318 [Friedmanniella antarctica]|uniref:Uncharacterized protein n=1 Tax=Microlunatus antarcticus TaxID=53388 RepID=A0A7W5P6C4_9ACTN|nr:hypothetical protein [Microlunatus antarcticus]